MTFTDEIAFAWRYLRSRRKQGFISVISIFSFLGIMLGVATLIIVMAVMNGFHHELLGRILGINAHLNIAKFGSTMPLEQPLINKLSQTEGVKHVLPVAQGQVLAIANEQHQGVMIHGMSKESLTKKPLITDSITVGSLDDWGAGKLVVGVRLAEKLGVGIGKIITFISPKMTNTFLAPIPRMKDYEIVAIFDVGMIEYDSSSVFMTLADAQTFLKLGEQITSIEIEAHDANNLQPIKNQLQHVITSDYGITDWQQANSSFFNSLKVERNVMFLILSLIIMVAAFNIISGMVMLVNSKGKEIAILRTMGMGKATIMRIFLLCGAFIGVVGTLCGVLLGVGFAANIETIRGWLEAATGTELFSAEIYFLSTLPAKLVAKDVIKVVGMALILSLLATLYPAWRASKQDPVEGLRYE